MRGLEADRQQFFYKIPIQIQQNRESRSPTPTQLVNSSNSKVVDRKFTASCARHILISFQLTERPTKIFNGDRPTYRAITSINMGGCHRRCVSVLFKPSSNYQIALRFTCRGMFIGKARQRNTRHEVEINYLRRGRLARLRRPGRFGCRRRFGVLKLHSFGLKRIELGIACHSLSLSLSLSRKSLLDNRRRLQRVLDSRRDLAQVAFRNLSIEHDEPDARSSGFRRWLLCQGTTPRYRSGCEHY